jgi:hypothetical protein
MTRGGGRSLPIQLFYVLCYALTAQILNIIIAIDDTSERSNVKRNFNMYDLFGKPYMVGSRDMLPAYRQILIFVAAVAIGGLAGALILKLLNKMFSLFLVMLVAFFLSMAYIGLFLIRDNVLSLFIAYKILNGIVLAMLSLSAPALLHAATPHISQKIVSAETSILLLVNGLLLCFDLFHPGQSKYIFMNFLETSFPVTAILALAFYLVNCLMSGTGDEGSSSFHLYAVMFLKSMLIFVWGYELLTGISAAVWLICVGDMLKLGGWKQILLFYSKMFILYIIGASAIIPLFILLERN